MGQAVCMGLETGQGKEIHGLAWAGGCCSSKNGGGTTGLYNGISLYLPFKKN